MGLLILIVFAILILCSPPIILIIIGLKRIKKEPAKAKAVLILAGLYLLIGIGVCGGYIKI